MTSDAGAGVKGMESKGLALGRSNDIPQVDIEFVAEAGHLVHQGNVDMAVRVFEKFGHLRLARPLGGHDRVDESTIKSGSHGGAGSGMATDDLGRVAHAKGGVAGVNALGTKGQVEVGARHESTRFQHGSDLIVRRARIGGGLQDDELPGSEMVRNGACRAQHSPQIGATLGL